VKALVTGATGFVGSHLTTALVERGDAVTALYRRPEARSFLETLGAVPAFGTLADAPALSAALDGADVVYHVAGLTSGSAAELAAVNHAATARLLEACARRATPPRFVYVSSQAAVGPSAPGVSLAEDAPCRPVTPYGASKLAGETAVRAATRVPWTVVRPPAVYGPRDREFLRLFQVVRRGIAPVFGTGAQQLSLVFVADLADLLARAGRTDHATGQTYHAAHPEIVTAAGVARAAGSSVGTRPLVVPLPAFVAAPLVRLIGWTAARAGKRTVVTGEKLAEFLAPAWLLDSTKAERELSWTAVYDLATGMAETARWYEREGWL